MAKFFRRKTLQCKTEVAYGVDPGSMTVSLAGMIVFNMTIKPMEGQDVERLRELHYFSAPDVLPTGKYAEVSFEVELVGHATKGTAPKWSAIAKACGLAEVLVPATSVTYTPVSTGFSSATIHVNVDDVRQVLVGCRGRASLRVDAHGLPKMMVTMWGIYAQPTDTAMLVSTPATFQVPEVVNYLNTPTFTMNAVPLAMRSFALDLGNQLAYRELVGVREVLITDMRPAIDMRIEATPLATFNPYALIDSHTGIAVNLVHGVSASKIVTVNCPNVQLQRVPGFESQDTIQEWPLKGTPLPVSGDDAFSIVLT